MDLKEIGIEVMNSWSSLRIEAIVEIFDRVLNPQFAQVIELVKISSSSQQCYAGDR